MKKPISYVNRRTVDVKGKTEKPNENTRHLYLNNVVGIYVVFCTETNCAYIGQSRNVKSRLKTHKYSLRNGKYKVRYPKWQADFDVHGECCFQFSHIYCCNEDELLKWETYHINEYLKNDIGIYNIILDTETPNRIINCPDEYFYVMSKLLKLLNNRTIDKNGLEQYLDNF